MVKELFNIAFLSIWGALSEQGKNALSDSLDIAYRSKDLPPEVIQVLLNLYEFLNHPSQVYHFSSPQLIF